MKYLRVGPHEYWSVPESETRNILKHVPEGATVEFVDGIPEEATQVGQAGRIKQYTINVKKRNAQYQKDYRARMIASGFAQVTVWVPKGKVDFIKGIAEDL